jgi:hypothetical protein
VLATAARYGLDEVRAVFLLLKARAEGWTLGADGAPTSVPGDDPDDAFWRWFHAPADRSAFAG